VVPRLLPIAAGLVLLLIGTAGGYYLGTRTSNDVARRVDLYAAAQSRYASFVFSRDNEGGVNADSLRAHLAYLEAQAREHANANLYAFDKALALTRMSEIARRGGASEEALRLADQAGSMCAATGLANCSTNELLRTVRERDRRAWGNPGG
jgi:hypothetical protein